MKKKNKAFADLKKITITRTKFLEYTAMEEKLSEVEGKLLEAEILNERIKQAPVYIEIVLKAEIELLKSNLSEAREELANFRSI